nr:hypothetical protein [Tanacetum cinerariifolium]
MLGYFARECKQPRNQDSKNRNQDSSRWTINVEEVFSKAMVAIDGSGYRSHMANDEVPKTWLLWLFQILRKCVGYSAIPPPYTRLFLLSKLDLSNFGLEEFQQPEFEGYGPKTSNSVSEDISNEVKESPDAPLVKELVSNDKLEKKTVFPTVAKIVFVRRHASKETGSSKDYILIPLWKYGSLFDSSSNNASNDEPQPYSDAGKKDDEGVSKKVELMIKRKKKQLERKMDFLNANHIRYALTENPIIYVSLIKQFWQTATARTLDNGEIELTATIDGKVKIVTEAFVRRHLQLEDSYGISSLPTTKIFEQLSLMGSPTQSLIADKAASTSVDVRYGGATTTVIGLEAGQGNGNIDKTPTMLYDLPLPRVNTPGNDEGKIQGRYGHDMEFDYDFDTAEKYISTAEPVSTGGAAVTTDSVVVSTSSPTRNNIVSTTDDITMAKTLVYIRKSAAKDKSKEEELDKESSKRQKTGESSKLAEEPRDKETDELSQEELQQMMIIVPEKGINVEALQTKYLIIDWEIYTEGTRKYWKIIRVGNHTEKLQKHIHDLTWRLYDSCGVHHMSIENGIDIYMLVEKEYPLSRGTFTLMLVAKLLVDEDNKMSEELLRKIFMQAEILRR